jgi:nicotinamidase-related amidase
MRFAMEEESPNPQDLAKRQRRALLVIDMLNDFLDDEGALYCGYEAERIIPKVIEAIEDHLKEDQPVIFLQDTHHEGDPEFRLFPPHCIEGSWGHQLIPVLVDYTRSDSVHVIQKSRYSGFHGTELERLLAQLAPEVVTVTGICTSICVMDTVKDLWERGLRVRVLKEGVADIAEEAHQSALERMAKLYGAEII